MSVKRAGERIRNEVESWPGIESRPHRFGGTAAARRRGEAVAEGHGAVEFVVGRRELGHVHGDHILDAPTTRAERDRLIAEGKAQPHHVLPQSGWITVPFRNEADVDQAIAVLRANYERAKAR